MGSVQKKSIKFSREYLIEQLIAHEVYKIDGKHLFQLPLSDLEHEYRRRVRCTVHVNHHGLSS